MKDFIDTFCKENWRLATGQFINAKNVALTLVKHEEEIQNFDMTALFIGIIEALKLESVRNLEGAAFTEMRALKIAKIDSELKTVYELIDKFKIHTIEELKNFIEALKKGFRSENLIQISPSNDRVKLHWSGHEHLYIMVTIKVLGAHEEESEVLRSSERKSIFRWGNYLGFLTKEMDPGKYKVICRNDKLNFTLKKS